MRAPRVVERLRVVDDDVAAAPADGRGDVERGGVADVVAVRLERRTQDGDTRAAVAAVDEVQAELDGTCPAAEVDLVDLAQERQRLMDAQLARPGDERPDVLGQAAAAETEARTQKLVADAVVVADRLRQRRHV